MLPTHITNPSCSCYDGTHYARARERGVNPFVSANRGFLVCRTYINPEMGEEVYVRVPILLNDVTSADKPQTTIDWSVAEPTFAMWAAAHLGYVVNEDMELHVTETELERYVVGGAITVYTHPLYHEAEIVEEMRMPIQHKVLHVRDVYEKLQFVEAKLFSAYSRGLTLHEYIQTVQVEWTTLMLYYRNGHADANHIIALPDRIARLMHAVETGLSCNTTVEALVCHSVTTPKRKAATPAAAVVQEEEEKKHDSPPAAKRALTDAMLAHLRNMAAQQPSTMMQQTLEEARASAARLRELVDPSRRPARKSTGLTPSAHRMQLRTPRSNNQQ